jgi:hypothetical protein
MGFKMKGWSGYQKSPLKVDAALVQGARDSVEDKTSGQIAKGKALSGAVEGAAEAVSSVIEAKKGVKKDDSGEEEESALKKRTDPPKDDDSVKMTEKQKAEHRAKVLEYNKNTAKPMTEATKRKIKEQLAKMDPNNPEAKLLQDMLNLPKNK